MNNSKLKRDLGLMAATCIVIGNIVGSGIFSLPTNLAKTGGPLVTIGAWIFAGIGSIVIIVSYGKLGTKYPESGGPVLFTRKAMGKFPAYMMSWVWWFGSFVGVAAIITLIVTNIGFLIPGILGSESNPNIFFRFLTGVILLVIFTYINIRGVKNAGKISIVTTVIKFSVFIIWILIALPHFKGSNFNEVSSSASGASFFSAFSGCVILIMWAFSGMDGATLTGGEIKNPEKNITRSSVLGVTIATVLYILINVVMIGFYPQEKLSQTAVPFSQSINDLFNTSTGGTIISLAIVLSVVGTLCGWILVTARSPYQASKEGLFFKSFQMTHKKYETPVFSLLVSALCIAIILFIPVISPDSQSISKAFGDIVTLAGIITLPTYFVVVICEFILTEKEHKNLGFYIRNILGMFFAFIFVVGGVWGSSLSMGYWIFFLGFIILGILLYLIFFKNKKD